MTSPGSWFGGFLDDTVGKKPSSLPGSSSLPQAPSNRTAPSSPQSADSWERSHPGYGMPTPAPTSKGGQILYSGLDLPDEWANETFTTGIDQSQVTDYYGNPVTRTVPTQMTVANGLAWLRDLASTDKEAYNSWVVKLYDGGYLEESELRFNQYTSVVAQAFAEAAHDTAIVNQSVGTGGSITSMGDMLQGLADGAAEAGLNGSGPTVVPRIDQQLDEATLKDTIRSTSRNLLGRALTDAEEASLVSRYRGVEAQWNDQSYAADVARSTGGTATQTSAPDAGVIAQGGINDTLGTERAAQQLGGYAGVLMNMVGLGHGTSVGGTLE